MADNDRNDRDESIADDTVAGEGEPVIRHLEEAIRSGRHWYSAILESIGLWTEAEEELGGRCYRYLIAGEAFDWLVLVERLCDAIHGLVPEDEKSALLFRCEPPLDLSAREFEALIG